MRHLITKEEAFDSYNIYVDWLMEELSFYAKMSLGAGRNNAHSNHY
jgi:hypothetical protein